MVQLAWDPGGRVRELYRTQAHFFKSKSLVKNLIWFIKRFVILFRFTQHQRMLATLAQCEFSMGKTLMVYDMNLREMENYEKIYTSIGRKL